MSNHVQYQLQYLFVNYGELIEIMRLFEIAIPFIDTEKNVFEILEQQFINEVTMSQNSSNLYFLIVKESRCYFIPPGSSTAEEKEFIHRSDPFIEISLMNIIELLISSSIIDKINDIEQLIISYVFLHKV